MREIIRLPLGHTQLQHDWAQNELNDIYAAYSDVQHIGVYVDAMTETATPVMVLIVTKNEENS